MLRYCPLISMEVKLNLKSAVIFYDPAARTGSTDDVFQTPSGCAFFCDERTVSRNLRSGSMEKSLKISLKSDWEKVLFEMVIFPGMYYFLENGLPMTALFSQVY